jgi:gamma-butyrobetaine dioxygenase
MDLMYYHSPPGLQFLHCLRNQVNGGSSIFSDSFRAASLLQLSNRHAFNSLVTTPVPFHYVNDNKHYYFSRPTIVLDKTDPYGLAIDHVNYSPPFQAPFEVDTTDKGKSNWRRFLSSFKEFAAFTEREDMLYEDTLQQGECIVFANRRILHGRRAFDQSGERWLKGTYIDWDDFQANPLTLNLTNRVPFA